LALVASFALESNLAVNLSEDGIILTDADVVARVEMRSALPNEYAACPYMCTGLFLYTKALGMTVTSIARRTDTLLVCKKLQIK
jgi:hypothetical protein